MRSRALAPSGRAGIASALVLVLALLGAPGCYTSEMTLVRSGLDSLRTQVETMSIRDSVAARTIEDTRRELGEQKDLLLATRATASSTQRETGETLGRLEGKLDDIMARFRIASERQPRPAAPPPTSSPATTGASDTTRAAATPAGPNPTVLYDQATSDLTQGRYPLALVGYRDFLRRFPDSDLADNAQYGAGECFFAQAQFDSARVEYARVNERWSSGDRAPAALYKLGLCEERLGHGADSKKAFEDLVKRFPQSGEAQLARDRIGARR